MSRGILVTAIVLLSAQLVSAAPKSAKGAATEAPSGYLKTCIDAKNELPYETRAKTRIAACSAVIARGGKGKSLAEAYFQRAEAQAIQEPMEAKADVEKALEIAPRNLIYLQLHAEVTARQIFGQGQSKVIDAEAAEKSLALIIAMPEASREQRMTAFSTRGQLRSIVGNPSGALADYSSALDLVEDGSDFETSTLLERRSDVLETKLGDLPKALVDLVRAATVYPEESALDELIRFRIRHGELDQAVADLSGIIESLKGGKKLDKLPVVIAIRAEVQARLERCDRAIPDFNAALEQMRRSDTTRNARSATLVMRGRCHWALGNSADASADFDAAVTASEELAEAAFWQGKLRVATGQKDLARESFARAWQAYVKASSVDDPRALESFLNSGKPDAVAETNKRLASLEDWRARPIRNITAIHLVRNGEFKGAMDLLPLEGTQKSDVLARLIRAEASVGLKDFTSALSDLTDAIGLDDQPYNYARLMAVETRIAAGQHEDALLLATSIVKRLPDAPYPKLLKGRALLALGRNEEAVAALTESIQLLPQPAAHYWRGTAFEALGDTAKAARDYRAASLGEVSRFEEFFSESSVQIMNDWWADRKLAANIAAGNDAKARLATLAVGDGAALGRRVALVIGNANYAYGDQLGKPAGDAAAVASSLRRLGFSEVIEKSNLGLQDFVATLKSFGDLTQDSDWALIYYSGHAVAFEGVNYLLPVDAKLERPSHVGEEAVAIDRVFARLASTRELRLVLVDAARPNSFASGALGGLAGMVPKDGVIVDVAAREGQKAEDGNLEHSPYTHALLEYIDKPGMDVRDMLRSVRERVMAITTNRQEPVTYGTLTSGPGHFFKPATP